MTDLPPGLEDFGARLRGAAEADIRRSRPRHRGFLRDLGFPIAATVLTVAAGASAVSLIDGGKGPPIRAERGDGAGLQAPKDPGVVAASATPDPVDGPPWAVRVYTNDRGEECAQVGRLRAGLFGQIQNGRFRELPPDAPGTCGPAARTQTLAAVERRADPPRTLVFGLAAARSVNVSVGSRKARVTPAGLGAFVVVFQGASRAPVVVDDGNGPPQRPQ